MWKNERFRISLLTPISRWASLDTDYLLDIWDGRKVLSVGWTSEALLDIRSFKRGAWEAAFLATAGCI
ncbi:hypothetical protein AEGHOMDF_2940 [Methylobacterium soli]|nr:hypothetical protein AEGHOMDF_2940 [Methylobacterium soli]